MEHPARTAAVAALFDRIADAYDNVGFPFFGPIADALVAELAPTPGQDAADLGCGRGEVARLLADAVAPGGSVVALDISPAMVDHARAALAGTGARVEVGDASDPPLPPGSFDIVAASLVLFFLPEPRDALARWVRLLRPGGRLGVTTFGAQSPVWRGLDGLLRPWMPPLDPRTTGPDSPFASDAGLERALTDAGAAGVTTTTLRVELAFRGVLDWERFTRSVGQRAAWDTMPPQDAAAVRDVAAALLQEAADASGRTVVWQDVRLTLGRRPS